MSYNRGLVGSQDIHSGMNVDAFPCMAGNSSSSTPGGNGEQAAQHQLSLARLQQLQFQHQQCGGMNTALPPHTHAHSHSHTHSLNTAMNMNSLQQFNAVNTVSVSNGAAAVSEMSFPSAHDESMFMPMDLASSVKSGSSPEPMVCNKPSSSSGTSSNSARPGAGGNGAANGSAKGSTTGTGTGSKAERYFVDHTYRDFSRKKPTEKDIIGYKHQKQINAERLLSGDMDDAMDTASCGSGSGSTGSASGSSASASTSKPKSTSTTIQKTGRGNKATKKGNTNFSGSMGTNFPARLHDLLSHEEGISDIITWLPHGRSWIVWDKERFIDQVASLRFQVRFDDRSS